MKIYKKLLSEQTLCEAKTNLENVKLEEEPEEDRPYLDRVIRNFWNMHANFTEMVDLTRDMVDGDIVRKALKKDIEKMFKVKK